MGCEDHDLVIDRKSQAEGTRPRVPAPPAERDAGLVSQVYLDEGLVPDVAHIHILQEVQYG